MRSIFVLVTMIDVAWHFQGVGRVSSSMIHHIMTLLLLYIQVTHLDMVYGAYMGIVETVAPFYQLITLRIRPVEMRLCAIVVNVGVRIPFLMYMIRAQIEDIIFKWNGHDVHHQVRYISQGPLALSAGLFILLDLYWTKRMLRWLVKRQLLTRLPLCDQLGKIALLTHNTPPRFFLRHARVLEKK